MFCDDRILFPASCLHPIVGWVGVVVVHGRKGGWEVVMVFYGAAGWWTRLVLCGEL